MNSPVPNLAGAAWLAEPRVRCIFDLLGRDGDSARIVGGAVRNALLGLPFTDIDFATTALPDTVVGRAAAAGIKCIPTGIAHGTVTLVVDGRPFEVTTLREDIETDGRHAVVRFGRDWTADALRRDFTINALSVDRAGNVFDLVGGLPDIRAGRVRFIGEPARRIAEDRLRILRFFRFHAQYGRGELDRDGLDAAIRARAGLRDLSNERIGQEMRKLAVAPRATDVAAPMQEAGILGIVLGGVGYLGAFARLPAFEAIVGREPSVALRLAALGCAIEEDAERIAARLRLANAERERMRAAVAQARAFRPMPDARAGRRLLYRLGPATYRDAAALAAAWSTAPIDAPGWLDVHGLPERWPTPRFPLGGRDILAVGRRGGPTVGEMLRALEAWWIERDFVPDEAMLRARLQQMTAAAQ